MHIGSYQVLLELARGGMGKVFLARTRGPAGVERLVAIKRAHEHLLSDSQEIAYRFLDEARIAAHVHHSNVVGVHQAGSDEQGHYLVLDYIEGESLNGLLAAAKKQNRRVPAAVVLRIVCDALSGLHAAHEATDAHGSSLGILHRDVSTHNLLVGRDGVTKLTDFGIAKSALSVVVTDEQHVQGKLVYMAPEYLQREPVGRPLDIYAMGITLWIALAGQSPWPDTDQAQVLRMILLHGVPSLTQGAPELGSEIAAVVDRACHSHPEERFQTAREMLDALEAAAESIGGLARHVEVSEFVEALVGRELAERRELVKARRAALDQESAEYSDVRPKAPRRASEEDQSTGVSASIAEHVSTQQRRIDRPRLFFRIAAVIAIVAAAGGVLVSVAALDTASKAYNAKTTPPVAVPAAPTVTQVEAPASPPVVVAQTSAATATAASATSEPRRSSARPPSTRKRSPRPQSTPAPSHAAPFSTVNPYR